MEAKHVGRVFGRTGELEHGRSQRLKLYRQSHVRSQLERTSRNQSFELSPNNEITLNRHRQLRVQRNLRQQPHVKYVSTSALGRSIQKLRTTKMHNQTTTKFNLTTVHYAMVSWQNPPNRIKTPPPLLPFIPLFSTNIDKPNYHTFIPLPPHFYSSLVSFPSRHSSPASLPPPKNKPNKRKREKKNRKKRRQEKVKKK